METSSSIAERIWHRYSDSIDGIIMSIPRRAATRSLELSARGRRPGAQQVPHYVHVHTHTHIYIIAPSSFSTHTHTQPTSHLARSHNRMTTAAVPLLHPFDRGIPPSLSLASFASLCATERRETSIDERSEAHDSNRGAE